MQMLGRSFQPREHWLGFGIVFENYGNNSILKYCAASVELFVNIIPRF
jgi:hypothetical protein